LKLKLLTGLFTCVALSALAQQKDSVVPVSREPSHHIRFDNGRVRVYDVRLPPGNWTLFHEHSWDNFFVFIVPATQDYEFIDGRHGTREVNPAEVGFTSTATGPYTHRARVEGKHPLHVVDIEILNNAQVGSGVAAPKRPEPHSRSSWRTLAAAPTTSA
jgi:hypothetical protein